MRRKTEVLLAQPVQSACFTRKRSAVRIRHKTQRDLDFPGLFVFKILILVYSVNMAASGRYATLGSPFRVSEIKRGRKKDHKKSGRQAAPFCDP